MSEMVEKEIAEGHPYDELRAQQQQLQKDWQNLVCQSHRENVLASSPGFNKVVYLVVPTTFKFVQIVLKTSEKKILGGVRFPSNVCCSDGCIGLRYARASNSCGTHGFYQALSCGASTTLTRVPIVEDLCKFSCCTTPWMQRVATA